MISFLKGHVIERNEETITFDVNGVGYELFCSFTTLADLAGEGFEGSSLSTSVSSKMSAEPVGLFVQTQVREDAFLLFGFSTALEKRMFNSLLKVNGVGPKMAIKILSAVSSLESLMNMIEAGDVKALSSLPKVGKKTAEQLILSLKGKLVLDGFSRATPGKAAPVAAIPRYSGVRADILSALINLGFRAPDVEKVVGDLQEDIDLNQGIRRGLQALSGGL